MFKRKLRVSCLLDLDHERHSPFGAAKREWLACVLERDRVDVLAVGIRTPLDHTPTKLRFLVGIVKIKMESDTRGSSRVFLALSEPSPVQIRIRSPSRPTQMGTLCGEPSGIRVARWAKLGASSKALISSESGIAMRTCPYVESDEQIYHLPLGCGAERCSQLSQQPAKRFVLQRSG